MTYASLLTPIGRGAVATVAVRGPSAAAIADRHFNAANGRAMHEQSIDRVHFGRWGEEEVVVCRIADDSIEIHCHGGHAASAAILESLAADGVTIQPWQDWLGGDEALIALAAATTERTAAILLDQHHGALRKALEQIETLSSGAAGNHSLAVSQLDAIVARAPLGRHLTQPWRVTIAGEPNVGKSSLINALVGYQRAIVFDTPGTTRDVVTAETAFDGWPVQLADTAGLRETTDLLEADGVQRARSQLASADLIVLVFDASQPWSEHDAMLASTSPAALRVFNKIDLAPDRSLAVSDVATSTLTGQGLPELQQAIVSRLVPEPPLPGAAVPFTESQIAQLKILRERLLA